MDGDDEDVVVNLLVLVDVEVRYVIDVHFALCFLFLSVGSD